MHVRATGSTTEPEVFEGVRCYDGEKAWSVRHKEHLQRFEDSARMYFLDLPFTRRRSAKRPGADPARTGCVTATSAAGLPAATARWAFTRSQLRSKSSSPSGPGAPTSARTAETRHPGQGFFPCRVSSASLIPGTKASGQYLNSILAKTESAKAGYEKAILLDERGMVCEGSGENIFMVKEGKVYTPPQSLRSSTGSPQVGHLGSSRTRAAGHRAGHRRSEPLPGRRIFMCGTAAEVVPVREVGDHPLGDPGEVTRLVQQGYEDAIYGRSPNTRNGSTWSANRRRRPEPSTV